MADLKPLLVKAKHEYEARKAAAERQVVRWEHWSGPAYDPKPLHFERALRASGLKRGKPVAKPTARTAAYGFDAQGRVVIDRQPSDSDGEPAYDEFFIYGKDAVESAAYRREPPHTLAYVTRQARRKGQPVSTDVLDADGTSSFSERYDYAKGRLTGIDVLSVAGKRKDRVTYDVVYERGGDLRAIRRHYDYGTTTLRVPIYWNPASGETLASLSDAVRRTLLDAVPAALHRAKIKEPAYCVALVYDTENDELPPLLAVGLESERAAWIAEEGVGGAADLIWSPGDFERYETGTIELDAPRLGEASEKLLQMILMTEKLEVPQRLLNEVAAALNGRSWKGVLPTTDDFVVFAVDVDGDDLAKNLKAAVPAPKRLLLKSRKLL